MAGGEGHTGHSEFTGSTYYGPTPGGFLTGHPPGKELKESKALEKRANLVDPRVRWAKRMASTLKQEASEVREEQERSMNLYLGKHWDLRRRPEWKFAIRDNYCVAAGARVSTEHGLLRIEDVPDRCSTTDGPVVARWNKGEKPVIKVTTDRGFRIICTPDHKLRTPDGWVQAKDLAGKIVLLRQPQFANKLARVGDVEITPHWGRWLGYYMGDGWCRERDGWVGICATATDEDVTRDVWDLQSELIQSLPVSEGGTATLTRPSVKTVDGATSVSVYRKSGVRLLQSIGAANGKRIVCVPDCIFRSPKSVIREFLRGLFEADGSCSKTQRQITLVSDKSEFVADVNLLLLGFGIHGRIIEQLQTKPPHRMSYHLYLGAPDAIRFMEEIGFVSERKTKRFMDLPPTQEHKHRKFDESDIVVSVEDAGTATVYDLSVDDERHQFSANGIIASNCFWVPEQWSAVLTDNKPTCVFSAYKREDQKEIDIAHAAFTEWYTRENVQSTIEDTVKLSRIEKKAYLHTYYDTTARGGKGEIKMIPVSGTQIYVNEEATSVENATKLMYEYIEPVSVVLARFKNLRGKLSKDAKDDEELDMDMKSGPRQTVPATSTAGFRNLSATPGQAGTAATATVNSPVYYAHASPPSELTSRGITVREFWLRQPDEVTTVHPIKWSIKNEPVHHPKTMPFFDAEGNEVGREPVHTVLTEGGILYELPQSALDLARIAETEYGGLKILDTWEAVDIVRVSKEVPVYPNGRRMVIVKDHVADDGCNPFGHGEWPFITVDAYRNPRKFYGKGDIDEIATLQDALNRLLSQLLDAAYLMGNPQWLLPDEATIADEQLTNAPGGIVHLSVNALRYGRREAPPDMPQYFFHLLAWLKQEIKDISGLVDMATGGGKPKGQIAAETVSMMQESVGVRFRQGIRNVEEAIVKLCYQWLGLAAQFYDQPRWVKIKDAAGVEETVSFIGSKLTSPMMVRAKPGSMLPSSPSARLNTLFQLMPTSFVDFMEVAQELEQVGVIKSATTLHRRMRRYVADFKKSGGDPSSLWQAPGLLNILMGAQKKGSGKAQGNAGRTARRQTPRMGG